MKYKKIFARKYKKAQTFWTLRIKQNNVGKRFYISKENFFNS